MKQLSVTMKWYQDEAHKTAIYPEGKAVEYVVTGLAGEAGEVLNIVKKQLRGDNLDFPAKLSEEMGGVLWYLVELMGLLGCELHDRPFNVEVTSGDKEADSGYMARVMFRQIAVVTGFADYNQIAEMRNHVDETLSIFCKACISMQLDPNEVAYANIALLMKRSAGGTIQGHNRSE